MKYTFVFEMQLSGQWFGRCAELPGLFVAEDTLEKAMAAAAEVARALEEAA